MSEEEFSLEGLFTKGNPHCDEYIEDEAQPTCLRNFLRFQRSPATFKCENAHLETMLFARTTAGVINLAEGTPVRVVMASRLGDVGITTDLERKHGYQIRVAVAYLTDFTSDAPEENAQ